jgi:hypothetical protein
MNPHRWSTFLSLCLGLGSCGGPDRLPRRPPPEYEPRPSVPYTPPSVDDPFSDVLLDSPPQEAAPPNDTAVPLDSAAPPTRDGPVDHKEPHAGESQESPASSATQAQ